ncbi:type II toxin-antitoxin system HigB family toxin [Niabella ginsengisoli]|uniref:Type II toxin-antitoxin system HigB family toxin n=1 Tax=Niabella ginsengisoli TaxID=522298 RepID=A0ABS9SG22_9BACT|nr:type II toxin-antitoxin system HigB family toxin [Niabella ginsengisoli]MCH5597124.1 type II toxin-antitoxin system HigB family toxin [Niabella ginsengisoli]
MKTILYFCVVNIINRKTIIYYSKRYPKAKNQFLTWYTEMLKLDFDNFNQLKEMFRSASIVNNQRVVFNIKGNEYRLVVLMNFVRKACYTIWFGTHEEYDKIDVATVPYNLDL